MSVDPRYSLYSPSNDFDSLRFDGGNIPTFSNIIGRIHFRKSEGKYNDILTIIVADDLMSKMLVTYTKDADEVMSDAIRHAYPRAEYVPIRGSSPNIIAKIRNPLVNIEHKGYRSYRYETYAKRFFPSEGYSPYFNIDVAITPLVAVFKNDNKAIGSWKVTLIKLNHQLESLSTAYDFSYPYQPRLGDMKSIKQKHSGVSRVFAAENLLDQAEIEDIDI